MLQQYFYNDIDQWHYLLHTSTRIQIYIVIAAIHTFENNKSPGRKFFYFTADGTYNAVDRIFE